MEGGEERRRKVKGEKGKEKSSKVEGDPDFDT